MEFQDYLRLVRIYNPPSGWYATRRAEAYAYKLQMEELSKEQTILRLLKDKALNRTEEIQDTTQQISWVSYLALGVAVVALIKAFA